MNILYLGGQITETVYLEHDNWIYLKLRDPDTYADQATTGFTKMSLTVGDALIESTNTAGQAIRWNQIGYETGEVRLQLGAQELTAGRYPRCYLLAYDSTYTNGRVLGCLQLFVLDDVEEET